MKNKQILGTSKDYIGEKFGRLTILRNLGMMVDASGQRAIWVECLCSCGNKKRIRRWSVLTGKTVSCGCYREDRLLERLTTHGMTYSRPYRIWKGMIQRCTNPNRKPYHNYGGRGIKVCKRWLSFDKFWHDMEAGYSDDLTLERGDTNKGYNKKNCCWATQKVQSQNRRHSKWVTHKGERKHLVEWGEELGVSYFTLRSRYDNGWSEKEILFGRS